MAYFLDVFNTKCRRHSQSIQVYLGADVLVRERGHARYDVVVVSASKVLVLQRGAVVQLRVVLPSRVPVEYPRKAEKTFVGR